MRSVKHILESKVGGVSTITPDASVLDALKRLAELDIGALVVTEGKDQIVGLMSERDYARKVILKGRHSHGTPVSDIMTSEVVCVGPEQTVQECMGLMTQKRIRHLPVVVDDRLVGIISIGDVVKAIIDEQQFEIEQLGHYIMGDR
jgi:CBS domain-containing protein